MITIMHGLIDSVLFPMFVSMYVVLATIYSRIGYLCMGESRMDFSFNLPGQLAFHTWSASRALGQKYSARCS